MELRDIAQMYQLCSQVMLIGMTDDLLPKIYQLPAFMHLDRRPSDDWKADHYALFGMTIYPFETEFLSEDGVLGGQVTDSVVRVYYEAGYRPDESEPVDHMGNQLGLMALLCDEEADARKDDVIQAILHTTQLQRRFLDKHLLCWLPALVISIHRQGDEAFSILADLMLELAFTHRQLLADDSAHPTQPLVLPPAPNILDDANTELKDIAEFLLTPVYSGIYLGRDDIVRLGARCNLPRGFGKRHAMLTSLLTTAAETGAMDELMQILQEEVVIWHEFYRTRIIDQHFSGAWISRLEQTHDFLATIRNAL